MERNDMIDIAKTGASVGFRGGFEAATDCIRSLVEGANNPEAQRFAAIMVKGLEQFADDAHSSFMEDITFKIVADADGNATLQ